MLRLATTTVDRALDAEAVFAELFAAAPACFWLDSSRVEGGVSRFSFLGDSSGTLSEVLTYRVSANAVEVRDAAGMHSEPGNIFDVLDERLRERRVDAPELPFDFTCGYVGYFGYELKADCGAPRVHAAQTPDAAWILADRLIAIDHEADVTYLVAMHDGEDASRAGAESWVARTALRLHAVRPSSEGAVERGDPATAHDPQPYLVRRRERYEADIAECRWQLMQGESYEICLTNKLRLRFDDDDDMAFYRRLRRVEPGPHAAPARGGGAADHHPPPPRALR